jgi:hypothetical protein
MTKLQRGLIMLSGIAFMTACQDSPTAPDNFMPPPSTLRPTITPDPTLVTFNSASCTLVSSAIGSVHCSWDISNPSANTVNLAVQVSLQASYDCIHPKTGRIATSEVRDLGTLYQESGVSSTSLTGTDVALSLPFLPTDYRGSMKKLNACKGNEVVQNLTWSMTYWEVTVTAIGGTLRQSCFAFDNRNGCYTS